MENCEREVANDNGDIVALLFQNGYSLLSNTHYTPFIINGSYYRNMEQFLYTKRAIVSRDYFAADSIMRERETRKYREYKLNSYDHEEWVRQLPSILQDGLTIKFSQNEQAREKLLSAGNGMIVYATPQDHVYGTGLSMEDNSNMDPSKWQGMNLLGIALATVREKISK